ncbi:hypothetical protein NKH77_52840 [Streptomyces sp. M19]
MSDSPRTRPRHDGSARPRRRLARPGDRGEPAPARQRTRAVAAHRWRLAWTLLPWLAVTVAVLGCGVLLDSAAPSLPSLVLLLAPVAPLPGVAVAWSRRIDPVWS